VLKLEFCIRKWQGIHCISAYPASHLVLTSTLLAAAPWPLPPACSEQRLADAVWPEPVNRELFARLVQPHLAALAAAGQDITQAHKAPDKVRCAGMCTADW
jgi:hypothetical protein